MRYRVFLLLLLTLLISCHHNRRGSHLSIGFSFSPVIGKRSSQAVLEHDGHIHDEFCGHPRRWYNNRWIYFYNGRWEYYDPEEGVYYYIPAEIIEETDD